jgi:hypothetical protein
MVYDAGFTTLCHANKEKSLSPLHQMSQGLKFLNRSRLREREREIAKIKETIGSSYGKHAACMLVSNKHTHIFGG